MKSKGAAHAAAPGYSDEQRHPRYPSGIAIMKIMNLLIRMTEQIVLGLLRVMLGAARMIVSALLALWRERRAARRPRSRAHREPMINHSARLRNPWALTGPPQGRKYRHRRRQRSRRS